MSTRGRYQVRNKLGLNLVSEKAGEERTYRIESKAASAKIKGKSAREAAGPE